MKKRESRRQSVERSLRPRGLIEELPEVKMDRRAFPRIAGEYNASCLLNTVSYNVELVNLSSEGAQIRMREGLMPSPGSRVELAFMDGEALPATVIWVNLTDCGLMFDNPIERLDERTHFDELGADFYVSVLKLQNKG